MIFRTSIRTLLAVEGDVLPAEFRIFQKGWNETKKGRFLFDDKSARAVTAAYEAWGVDLMIDLEHASLEAPAGAPDPTARDARGWCRLELRDGELWATGVTWTPDGAQRLREKRQRYVSPAFNADPKTKRITQMINVAITALPATHHTPALVAASRRIMTKAQRLAYARNMVTLAANSGLDPALVQKALDAVEKGDAKAALEILKGLIASAAGAEPPTDGEDDGAEGDGAEGVAPPEPETEAVEQPRVVDASADDADDDGDDNPEKKTERKAMHALLRRLTGKLTLASAVAEVEIFRSSHVTLETERQKLAKERATLESAERRKLCVDLIALGAEFPATVWSNPVDVKASTLKARWLKMPVEELRAHVADQRAARAKKNPAGKGLEPAPQTTTETETVELTAEQIKICKEMGTDPKDFAVLLARRDGKKGG